MDYVKPLPEGTTGDILVMAAPCCTRASPCQWHAKAFVSAGYHLCPKCGAVCDCEMRTGVPGRPAPATTGTECANGRGIVLCARCKLREADSTGVCATCHAEITENVLRSLRQEENEKEARRQEWQRRRR